MLLYDELRTNLHRLPVANQTRNSIADSLAAATVIEVSNVAHFYYEDDREVWTLNDDIPNAAPPWPVAFFEFRVPRMINSDGWRRINPDVGKREGLLVISQPIDEMHKQNNDEEVLGRIDLAIRSAVVTKAMQEGETIDLTALDRTRERLRAAWDHMDAEQHRQVRGAFKYPSDVLTAAGGRWHCQAVWFVQERHALPMIVTWHQFVVGNDGQILPEPGGKPGNIMHSLGVAAESLPTSGQLAALKELGSLPLHVPLLATSFAHCKNVSLQAVDPPERLARKQIKRHGQPTSRYYVLEIEPMRAVLRKEGHADTQGNRKALHICRGHFKDYRERGLFGRYHGVYWWDSHARGDIGQGVVTKDYLIGKVNT